MLSYQHGYHAGNFADVVKHVALARLLNYLLLKDKPLFYLETHSGKGQYDLKDKQAEKTGEYKQGISLLWEDRKSLNPVFKEYIETIKKINNSEGLRLYPGSPYIAINTLRKCDRAILCELHPNEFEVLNQMPHFNKRIHVRETDGIASLNALLPPLEKRGLIFIDPSFEVKDEYKTIPSAIKKAYSRFSTGVYCLWYPIVNRRLSDQLLRGMHAVGAKNSIYIEFYLTQARMEGMSGCGLWIINPPYTFATEMKQALDSLRKYFNPGCSSYIIETYTEQER